MDAALLSEAQELIAQYDVQGTDTASAGDDDDEPL